MRLHLRLAPTLLLVAALGAAEPAKPALLPTPAQDQGLPYTRSARSAALAALGDTTAVCVGSRYAWVRGHRVRLDDQQWRAEAVLRDGEVWVPAAFAPVVLAATPTFDTAPAYLADRWVHTVSRSGSVPAGVRSRSEGALTYVALADLAKAVNRPMARGGLLAVVGTATLPTGPVQETIVSQFDTPDKFADPDLATRHLPTATRQGRFTDYAKATPEQLANFLGDQHPWPTTPASQYDERGIDRTVFGSPVPPPGVYPRLLFSPEDIPALQQRVTSSVLGQKSLIEMEELFAATWWDASKPDGKLFQQLIDGSLKPEQDEQGRWRLPAAIREHKAGIYNSHVAYVPECLTAMATWALIRGDDAVGRKAAAALASFYRLIEPLADDWNAISDSEWASGERNGSGGATTIWRGMHGLVAHCNLGMGLDLAGKWMTAAEKDDIRRLIAKATYGRRPYSQEATTRFRDVNWCTWDLPHYLAVAAIEGLEGCDPEGVASNLETIVAFCDWGIDDQGVVFESTGKSTGSFPHFFMSALTAARRGTNVFAHPHLRKLLTSQAQMTSPTGLGILNSGTQYSPYNRQVLSPSFVSRLRAIYPQDRAADWLLAQQKILAGDPDSAAYYETAGFDPEAYRTKVRATKRLRLPSPTYNGFVRDVLHANDWKPTTRADLDLPLDYVAPTHGVLATRSDQTTDAAFISMMVRPNHYLGAGHHHADAGMLHVAALGQDWLTSTRFHQVYDGHYFNLVTVDGISQPTNIPGVVNGYNGVATWLGATTGPGGAAASADLTYAYSWRWMTQPPQVWPEGLKALGWEVDPTPGLQPIFAGMGRSKLRQWWHGYTWGNAIPTLRAPFNPMAHVYRTAALVRGERPWLLVTDDLKKDDQTREYAWQSPVSGGVWKAAIPGLPADQIVLAYDPAQKAEGVERAELTPAAGSPLLLVASIGTPGVQASVGLAGELPDRKGQPQRFERVVLSTSATEVRFRIALVPFRAGEPVPQIAWNPATGTATVTQGRQTDTATFTVVQGRTKTTVQRAGADLLATP